MEEDILPNPHNYIPHQAVIRPDKSTTKLRVVFNASAKTSNDVQGGEDSSFTAKFVENCLENFSADSPLKTYRLTTVTYAVPGTVAWVARNCAPFLATRTLLQFLQKLQKKNVDDIFLTSRKLNHARDALVRQDQTQEFNAELKALRLGNNIPPQK
ncbi:hypothetical protein TNIN_228811 [Trichonephila inaurata madagascariensis]|uniref:Uncharacterized protein n=1 Tax=Trichonephila inaurata madagascariensis TaxID=2747483 RepID=A0A8X6JZX3_9ARAC|nr:hypothetical protein TNIN_228811 [Trichonephila inaurata madagascariensis]